MWQKLIPFGPWKPGCIRNSLAPNFSHYTEVYFKWNKILLFTELLIELKLPCCQPKIIKVNALDAIICAYSLTAMAREGNVLQQQVSIPIYQ